MKDADLRSALAESIRRFVEYKRALNRRYRPEAAALRLFDRYLYENNITEWDGIDSISTERFLQSRPRTRPRSYNHLLGVLHRFFDWAVVQRLVANNPVTAARHREHKPPLTRRFVVCSTSTIRPGVLPHVEMLPNQ